MRDPKEFLAGLSKLDGEIRLLTKRAEEMRSKVEARRQALLAEYVRNCK